MLLWYLIKIVEYIFKKIECISCSDEKDLEAFTWTPSRENNRNAKCRSCVSIEEFLGIPTDQYINDLLTRDCTLNRTDIYSNPKLIEVKRNYLILKYMIDNGTA